MLKKQGHRAPAAIARTTAIRRAAKNVRARIVLDTPFE
jgi:hypothetical protein